MKVLLVGSGGREHALAWALARSPSVGTILVAPVTIGRGAKTGAGAVVTKGKNVKDGKVVVGIPARELKK